MAAPANVFQTVYIAEFFSNWPNCAALANVFDTVVIADFFSNWLLRPMFLTLLWLVSSLFGCFGQLAASANVLTVVMADLFFIWLLRPMFLTWPSMRTVLPEKWAKLFEHLIFALNIVLFPMALLAGIVFVLYSNNEHLIERFSCHAVTLFVANQFPAVPNIFTLMYTSKWRLSSSSSSREWTD